MDLVQPVFKRIRAPLNTSNKNINQNYFINLLQMFLFLVFRDTTYYYLVLRNRNNKHFMSDVGKKQNGHKFEQSRILLVCISQLRNED